MIRHRIALLLLSLCLPTAIASANSEPAKKTIYDYALVGLDGKEVPLSTYKGKVLLIVNLASKSIYKHQVTALNDLQKLYADKGLVIVGIPSTDFGAQESEDNAAIKQFYLETEHVTFSVFSRASLRGKSPIPLVHFLTDPKEGAGGGDVHWNFTKFLVNREGKAVLRFEADSDPADPEFRVKVEQVLDGTFKKGPASTSAPKPSDADDDSDDGE